jgi:molecular chaperone GrpE
MDTASASKENARLLAQLANERSRFERQQRLVEEEAVANALRPIAQTLDDLARALVHRPGDADLAALQRALRSRAEALGLQTVACGAGFDPLVHESVGIRNIPGVASGTIVEILRSGWRYRQRLLSPALVVVNRWEDDDD